MSDETNGSVVVDPASATPPTPTIPEGQGVSAKSVFGEDVGATVAEESVKVAGKQPQSKTGLDRESAGVKPPEAAKSKPPAVDPPKAPDSPKPEAAKPAAPAEPAKIKIGGKEYTEAQLAELLAPRQDPPKTPPAAEAPAAKPPTAEEISQREGAFVEELSKEVLSALVIPEGDMEAIALGDKKGAEVLTTHIARAVGRAVLEARKTIFADVNPVLSALSDAVRPIQTNFEQIERHAAAAQFTSTFPHLADDIDRAREIGEMLLSQYPQEIAKMTRVQFLAEVARQTEIINDQEFRRWNPTYKGTWKEYREQAKAASAAPAPVDPVQTDKPTDVPPKPVPPKVRPLSANSPMSSPVRGDEARNWHKNVANSLASG